MKIFISALLLLVLNNVAFCKPDELSNRLLEILIESYDNYEGCSFMEKMVLKFSRNAYIDNLHLWNKYCNEIDNIPLKLHPQFKTLIDKVEKHGGRDKSEKLKNHIEELTYYGYKNIQLFYESVKIYIDVSPDSITPEIIDQAVSNPKFYKQKKELYDDEEKIKNQIKQIISSDDLKYKLSFYNFAYDFLNDIRKKIIKRDMDALYKRIRETGNVIE